MLFLQFREKRIEQERDLIERQNKWLNEELKNKTDELVQIRKEKVFGLCILSSFLCLSVQAKIPLTILNTVIDQFSLLSIFFARFFVSFSSISVKL